MAPFRREGRGFHQQPPEKLHPFDHEMIGRRLRLHYENLEQQNLPDRLASLLEQLDELSEEPAPPRRN